MSHNTLHKFRCRVAQLWHHADRLGQRRPTEPLTCLSGKPLGRRSKQWMRDGAFAQTSLASEKNRDDTRKSIEQTTRAPRGPFCAAPCAPVSDRPDKSRPANSSAPRAAGFAGLVHIGSMPKKMLIDATHAEETRVVVVDGNKVEEFDFESENKRQLAGNIYLAKVTRVEPSLQAAFVDYGGNRHGFLAFSEIHPDYYQIPVADRQALLEEERAYAEAQAAKELSLIHI